jgi:hypothetical protein
MSGFPKLASAELVLKDIVELGVASSGEVVLSVEVPVLSEAGAVAGAPM